MRKMLRSAAALLMGTILVVALALLIEQVASVRADAGVLYVAPGGNCGGSTPNCYGSVQAAVDAADEGDEVRVAAGTYTDVHSHPAPGGYSDASVVSQVVYVDKPITIRGGYAITDWNNSYPLTRTTTLNAQGQGRVIFVAGEVAPSIEGFRVTGGDSAGLGGSSGMDAGGGIYIFNAPATINANRIMGNTGRWVGGGLYLESSNATISDNVITENTANFGAGVYLKSSGAMLTDNLVTSNTASWVCGGVYLAFYSDATLNNNTISDNSANASSGVYLSYHSHAVMSNNVIVDNQANGRASGLEVSGSSASLLHTTIARNSGGTEMGVYVTSDGSIDSTVLLSNTIIADQAVGMVIEGSNMMAANGILWHETPVTVSKASTSTVTVRNQQSGDPAFAADGYHLLASSEAIDVGVDAGVYTDIDEDPRPQGGGFDLGADEFDPVTLAISYAYGKPGSFFTVTGSNFPSKSQASVVVNGNTLTDALAVDSLGSLVFLLDTSQADPGRYSVTVRSNPSATLSFALDPSFPLRPQEGTGIILEVPSGIAFTNIIYLPLVQR